MSDKRKVVIDCDPGIDDCFAAVLNHKCGVVSCVQ